VALFALMTGHTLSVVVQARIASLLCVWVGRAENKAKQFFPFASCQTFSDSLILIREIASHSFLPGQLKRKALEQYALNAKHFISMHWQVRLGVLKSLMRGTIARYLQRMKIALHPPPLQLG
jgi:hypothetical protein